MTQLQKSQLRPKCRKILEKYRRYNFILDDESCFTLSHTNGLKPCTKKGSNGPKKIGHCP